MQLGNLSRVQLYGIVSSACFAATILNAFRVRSNFYAAAVYLSKSNACMMVSSLQLTSELGGTPTRTSAS